MQNSKLVDLSVFDAEIMEVFILLVISKNCPSLDCLILKKDT